MNAPALPRILRAAYLRRSDRGTEASVPFPEWLALRLLCTVLTVAWLLLSVRLALGAFGGIPRS